MTGEQSASKAPNAAAADPAAAAAQGLLRQATGFQLSQAIWVAAKLSVADHLRNGPMRIEALAALTQCHPRALYRLLRALAAFGILRETEPGVFALAPQGLCLCAGDENSIRDQVLLFTGENFWQTWGALLHCVHTGDTAFAHLFGVRNSFEYYAQHPDESARMNHAMTAGSRAIASAVVAACDFSAARTAVDIGGGHGTLIAGILAANLGLRGVLFDFASVVAGASASLDAAGVADRCDVVAGDMFASVPPGHDVYLLSRVINICDDAEAVTVLKNCHAVMAPGARVILIERVLPDIVDATPMTQSKMMSDLTMLVRTGGVERTEAEFRALLSAAGLRARSVVSTAAPVSVIEAVRG